MIWLSDYEFFERSRREADRGDFITIYVYVETVRGHVITV